MRLFKTHGAALEYFRFLPGSPIMRQKPEGWLVLTGTIEAEKDLKND